MNGQFYLPAVSDYNPGEILMAACLENLSPDQYTKPGRHLIEIFEYQKFIEIPGLKERHEAVFFARFHGENATFDFRRTMCAPWPSLLAVAWSPIRGPAVGFAQANIIANGWYAIENVMVDPDYEGSGFSRAVMEALMHRLIGLAKWAFLSCDPDNESMYAKYGFFKIVRPTP